MCLLIYDLNRSGTEQQGKMDTGCVVQSELVAKLSYVWYRCLLVMKTTSVQNISEKIFATIFFVSK